MAHSPAGRPPADVRAMPLLSDRAYERIKHDIIVCALARGDGDTAERICREQIEAARGMVLSAILTSSAVMNLALGMEGPR